MAAWPACNRLGLSGWVISKKFLFEILQKLPAKSPHPGRRFRAAGYQDFLPGNRHARLFE
ncbi:MAG: hypothetical protein B7Z80_22710 [Rhodospirillales bacterium 20-64-7]|nr:MAG: hypothetical protein B7Z80_22710 [Rhodospirillales bacterium 20-64-7]